MPLPIKRFFKAIWYTITFRAPVKGDQLLIDNPEVVIRIYKNIISKKRNNLLLYKKGVEKLTVHIEKKIEKKRNIHKGQSVDINNIEKMKARAINEQKNIITELQKTGISTDEIEQHPTFLRFYAAENNFQTILKMKYNRLTKLEHDIEKAQKDIESHTYKLTCLQKDMDQLEKELFEMEADRFFEIQQEEFNKIKSHKHEDQLKKEQAELTKKQVQEILEIVSTTEVSIKNSHDRLSELHRKIIDYN